MVLRAFTRTAAPADRCPARFQVAGLQALPEVVSGNRLHFNWRLAQTTPSPVAGTDRGWCSCGPGSGRCPRRLAVSQLRDARALCGAPQSGRARPARRVAAGPSAPVTAADVSVVATAS